ncbi:MAG TPA: hypothetical protein VM432_05265 [Bdellovibrionales bacterium]|nr:hypothetical protein [Bdellovibrionales bacterium]
MNKVKQLARRLKTPRAVQKYLRSLAYNREERGETLRSAEAALKAGKAHCLEATFIAAAVLGHHGYPPTVLSFESQDGLDHVLFVFQEKGLWGAIGRSRDEGLHGRPPIYRSLRDLTWSYFDPYIDKSGKITAYQIAHLDSGGADWRKGKAHAWKLESYLLKLAHKPLRSSQKRYRRIHKLYLKRGPMPNKPHWW